ncbi:MAG: hypothetical protein KDC16_10935 [Saprospiraceae bacterium]|nr:hypothetical protein [Saprospiraceae bacterium]MCB9327131.1 hypothetical protein [Lewinellaceae bacterium]
MNCKTFFKGLVVLVCMFVATASYSQNYVGPDEAIVILKAEIETLKNQPDTNVPNGTLMAPNSSTSKEMKIALMGKLINFIDIKKAVGPAFDEFQSRMNQQPTERKAKVLPFINELKNLLS